MKPFASLLTLLTCCVLIGTANVSAQCTGQDVPDCTCEQLTAKSLTICIGGMNYNITVFSCEQVPSPNPIGNPCYFPYDCSKPTQSRISWIKQICVPVGFPVVGTEVIYNAIICATDLCTNDYLGVSGSFPTCNPSTPPDACTSTNRYCHTIAFPKCVEWDGLCLNICDEDCDQYCYVQRAYCKFTSACYTCNIAICSDPDAQDCPGNCTEVDCDNLSFTACCQ
jgi:hypothetical protein